MISLVPVIVGPSFFVCFQSREYSEEGTLMPTNAASALMTPSVTVLSSVCSTPPVHCTCALPCLPHLHAHPCVHIVLHGCA